MNSIVNLLKYGVINYKMSNVGRISQRSYFGGYSIKDTKAVTFKRNTLNYAQTLKQKLSDNYSNKEITNALDKITISIQNKINRGTLSHNDVNEYKQKLDILLKSNVQVTSEDIINYVKFCIILSKHDTTSRTKYNYFGITNKTGSIKLLASSRNSGDRGLPLLLERDIMIAIDFMLTDVITTLKPAHLSVPVSPSQQSSHTSTEYKAASVIQSWYRKKIVTKDNIYRINENRVLLDIKDKKQIYMHMETVGKFFQYVATAEIENQSSLERIEFVRSFINEARNNGNFIKIRAGNCFEIAQLLFILINRDPLISEHVKNNLFLCQFQFPGDHTFLSIGNPENSNAIIVDGWLKFLDLKSNENYRPSKVLAIDKDRKVGFCGTKEQFLKCIKANQIDTGRIIKINFSLLDQLKITYQWWNKTWNQT